MSQPQRRIYLPLAGTAFLSLLVGIFLFAWKRFAKPNPSTKVAKHSVKSSPEDTLAYWTEDKMRQAKPAPLPTVDELKREKHSPHSSRPQQD